VLDHQSTVDSPELTLTRSFRGAIDESERASLEEEYFDALFTSLCTRRAVTRIILCSLWINFVHRTFEWFYCFFPLLWINLFDTSPCVVRGASSHPGRRDEGGSAAPISELYITAIASGDRTRLLTESNVSLFRSDYLFDFCCFCLFFRGFIV
jgi:hypothetical protein